MATTSIELRLPRRFARARPATAEVELAAPAVVSFDEALAVAGRAHFYRDPRPPSGPAAGASS